MRAYTILRYSNSYEYLEERDELIEEYLYLSWSLCSLTEMIEELDNIIDYDTASYYVIVDDMLTVVHTVTIS